MPTRRSLIAAAAAALPLPAFAQAPWPSRPIRLVVPFAAGGGTDVVARIYAAKLGELLGQPVVIENRAGAGGNIGIESVVRAAPDGYSFVLSSNGPVAVNRHLFRDMPFDPARDLLPVSMTFRIEQALVVNPGLPARNVQEFIELARKRELNWARAAVAARSISWASSSSCAPA
jgi:tripartite-type tricarboxylate transporter receptor subunit TctC